MKKTIAILLAVLIILCGGFTASASKNEIAYSEPLSPFTVGASGQDNTVFAKQSNLLSRYSPDMLEELMARMRDAIVSYDFGFSLTQYNISSDALSALCQEMWNLYPEVFLQIDYEISWSYYAYSGMAINLNIAYLIPKSQHAAKQEFYYSEIDRIISTVPSGLSTLEKVIYINEYLTKNYVYDYNVEYGSEIHDSYGFLYENRGVCQAYALTFLGLMRELGIECRYAYNSIHAWNIVNIDGQYYHIDCTHNDPITYYYGDLAGRVSHDHLLVSTDALLSRDDSHNDWTSSPAFRGEVVCDNTAFNSAFWNDINTPFIYYNGSWYGISNTRQLIKADSTFKKVTAVCDLNYYWPIKGQPQHSWSGFFSGLTLIGNTLYFNTYNSIVSYNIDTRALRTVKTFYTQNNIYSSVYKDGKIYCVTADSPDAVPDSEQLVFDLKMGDINRDGTVAATDFVTLKKHLLGIDSRYNIGFADVIHDNRIDLLDLIRMKKYVSGLI